MDTPPEKSEQQAIKDYYDPEALRRFIDKISANQDDDYKRFIASLKPNDPPRPPRDINQTFTLANGITDAELMAAARTLAVLLVTTRDIRKDLGIKHKRGQKKGFRELDETIHSPEFGIVVGYAAGEITKTQAENLLMEIISEKPGKENKAQSRTTARKFIDARLTAAQNVAAMEKQVADRIEK